MDKLSLILVISLILSACDSKEVLPKACFSFATEGSPKIGEKVMFVNCSENAGYYLWEFGDGERSLNDEPEHSYQEARKFTVQLTAQKSEFEDLNGDGIITSDDRLRTATIYIMQVTVVK